jgi:hypothetical protein
MTRITAVLVVALALCAVPAHSQSARAKAKQDSIDRANAGKSGGKAVTAPAPAAVPAPAQAAAQGAKNVAKPVEAGAPQSRGSLPDTGSSKTLQREVFSYADGGRRDPAVSLMNTEEIRPLITEVQLMGIVYDEEGMNHMAILRNIVDKKTQYRVKVGQMLGRLKVTQITRREVVFTVDEFGFSRQERLSLKPDTTAKRTP